MSSNNIASPALSPRSDITSMLLPLFPDSSNGSAFETSVDGHKIRISIEGEHYHPATQADRRVLDFVAGALAMSVRSGIAPSRTVVLPARPLLRIVSGDRSLGGEDYLRLRTSLERLMATVIETEHPLAFGKRRFRRLRLIDAFQYDQGLDSDGNPRFASVEITLSDDFCYWIMREPGIDTDPRDYRRLTTIPGSAYRIYQIFLAGLLKDGTGTVRMPLKELRDRIPLTSDLKVFKARALKQALKIIAEDEHMSRFLRLELERETQEGFAPLGEGRCALDKLYVAAHALDLTDAQAACLVGPSGVAFLHPTTVTEIEEVP